VQGEQRLRVERETVGGLAEAELAVGDPGDEIGLHDEPRPRSLDLPGPQLGDAPPGAQGPLRQPGGQQPFEHLGARELVHDLHDVARFEVRDQLGVEQFAQQPGCPAGTRPEQVALHRPAAQCPVGHG